MAGWLTDGFPQLGIFTGSEQLSLDTELSGGASPQTAMSTLMQLAVALKYLANAQDKATVSGTRYYSSYVLGSDALLTGIEVLVGSTGGTDLWLVELHDSAGTLVATSTTSGTTAGSAGEFQRLAFTAPYEAVAGTYYLAIQSNGNTAVLATFGSAALPLTNGSATGTFGTGAAITPPTTYSANLGPVAQPY